MADTIATSAEDVRKGRAGDVAEIDRKLYDFTMPEEGYERYEDGLTPEIVRSISAKKDHFEPNSATISDVQFAHPHRMDHHPVGEPLLH